MMDYRDRDYDYSGTVGTQQDLRDPAYLHAGSSGSAAGAAVGPGTSGASGNYDVYTKRQTLPHLSSNSYSNNGLSSTASSNKYSGGSISNTARKSQKDPSISSTLEGDDELSKELQRTENHLMLLKRQRDFISSETSRSGSAVRPNQSLSYQAYKEQFQTDPRTIRHTIRTPKERNKVKHNFLESEKKELFSGAQVSGNFPDEIQNNLEERNLIQRIQRDLDREKQQLAANSFRTSEKPKAPSQQYLTLNNTRAYSNDENRQSASFYPRQSMRTPAPLRLDSQQNILNTTPYARGAGAAAATGIGHSYPMTNKHGNNIGVSLHDEEPLYTEAMSTARNKMRQPLFGLGNDISQEKRTPLSEVLQKQRPVGGVDSAATISEQIYYPPVEQESYNLHPSTSNKSIGGVMNSTYRIPSAQSLIGDRQKRSFEPITVGAKLQSASKIPPTQTVSELNKLPQTWKLTPGNPAAADYPHQRQGNNEQKQVLPSASNTSIITGVHAAAPASATGGLRTPSAYAKNQTSENGGITTTNAPSQPYVRKYQLRRSSRRIEDTTLNLEGNGNHEAALIGQVENPQQYVKDEKAHLIRDKSQEIVTVSTAVNEPDTKGLSPSSRRQSYMYQANDPAIIGEFQLTSRLRVKESKNCSKQEPATKRDSRAATQVDTASSSIPVIASIEQNQQRAITSNQASPDRNACGEMAGQKLIQNKPKEGGAGQLGARKPMQNKGNQNQSSNQLEISPDKTRRNTERSTQKDSPVVQN